jgi:hypothetical protein
VALLTTFWAGAGVELWAKLDAEKVITPTNSGCEETTTLTFSSSSRCGDGGSMTKVNLKSH